MESWGPILIFPSIAGGSKSPAQENLFVVTCVRYFICQASRYGIYGQNKSWKQTIVDLSIHFLWLYKQTWNLEHNNSELMLVREDPLYKW